MKDIILKPDFIARTQAIHNDKGMSWLQQLPQLIDSLEKTWGFKYLSPVVDLSYAFVALVEYQNKDAILKIHPEPGAMSIETSWLKLFPKSAPQIYKENEQLGTFLMERLRPGSSLKSLVKQGQDDLATQALCSVVRSLQTKKVSTSGFKHLGTIQDIHLLRGQFDAVLVAKAEELYRALTVPDTTDVVLHGDLHHDNVLRSGEDWKVIDPHGYYGDSTFEIAPMMYNPLDILPHKSEIGKVLRRRLAIIKDEMPYDPRRVDAWAFCMVMLSMAWTWESTKKVPQFEAEVARSLHSLV